RREPGELEEPERARPRLADPRVALERAADDVLEHRHPAECAHELPGAGDAEPRDALWAGAGDVGAGEDDPPRVRVRVAGDAVEERGLAGAVRAMSPTISPAEIASETSLLATRPPKRFVTERSSRSVATLSRVPRAGPRPSAARARGPSGSTGARGSRWVGGPRSGR